MPTTRNQSSIQELFATLAFNTDSESDDDISDSASIFQNSENQNMAGDDDTSVPSLDDTTNPFAFKIDLKDKIGNSLFVQATKGVDKENRISLSISTAQKFKDQVDRAAADFCWGTVVSDIKNAYGNSKDLLNKYKDLTLQDVKTHADVTWNCRAHDNVITPFTGSRITADAKERRIRSTMLAKWIRKSLNDSDQKTLDLKKKHFQYKHATKKTIEEDGPLMLKLIYDRINPSTRVGVRNLISSLFKFNLNDYDQDVPKMADAFETAYNWILKKPDETVKPEGPFFDALLTSSNEDFVTGIKTELTKWESGTMMTLDEIKDDAIKKYNNISERMKKDGKSFTGSQLPYNKTSSASLSDDKAKIIALTTQLEDAKQQLLNAFASKSSDYNTQQPPSTNTGGGVRKPNIDAWRMKKTLGDKVQKDGKWFYWCPHHQYPGFYDGLYVTHPPEKHDEWKDRQDKFKGRGKYANKSNNNSTGTNSSGEAKLVLSDAVKQALLTDHGFTPLQLEQLQRAQEN